MVVAAAVAVAVIVAVAVAVAVAVVETLSAHSPENVSRFGYCDSPL